MNTLRKLDTLLSEDSADDYWGDAGIDLGCEIAAMLSEDDWENLREIWRLRSQKWQCRFANLLDGVKAEYGVPILLTMLSSDDDRVVLSSIDSLDGIDDSLKKFVHCTESGALVRLQKLQHRVGEDEALIIQEISERIKAAGIR